MKPTRYPFLLAVLLPVVAQGADADSDLPQPFDPNSVVNVLQNSPFSRMVNISESLVLTGIAYIEGKPVATILNKDTKQSYVVSEKPNAQGWTLNEALPAAQISKAQAKISIGGEVVSVRYDSEAMTPENMKKKEKRPEGGGGPPGPPPGGDDRYRRSSRGPSEEDRKRYESLSDGAREKFRNILREKMMDERFRNAPEEERRNVIRNAFDKIEKDDKGGK